MRKLSRIEVLVNSYANDTNWILRTDDFETKLNEGVGNEIDVKSIDAKFGLFPNQIEVELQVPEATQKIFDIGSGKSQPFLEIKIYFEKNDELHDIEDSLLIVG